MLSPFIYYAFLATVTGYAFLHGTRDARLAAAICILATIATKITRGLCPLGLGQSPVGVVCSRPGLVRIDQWHGGFGMLTQVCLQSANGIAANSDWIHHPVSYGAGKSKVIVHVSSAYASL